MHLSLSVKMADHSEEKSNEEGNNSTTISFRHSSYSSHFKTVVLKYAEQTNNCEAARKYIVS
jgi:hypothetical protein